MRKLWAYHWIMLGLVVGAILATFATLGVVLAPRSSQAGLFGLLFIAVILGMVFVELVYRVTRLFQRWREGVGYNG